MKRLFTGVFAGIIAMLWSVQPVSAGVNDFTFTSFEADYYLGKDSDSRSTLRTVERLQAVFPSSDQNHGIERAIPKRYDGHSTSLKIESITDDSGKNLPYETREHNGNLVLRIGDSDQYVHGLQTYVISYTQRDVTKFFSSTNKDEFYRDTNGIQWRQPFGTVTARIHLDDTIRGTVSDDMACYYGPEGSTQRCDVATTNGVITAQTSNLQARENMTLAVGFAPETFKGYEPSLWERFLAIWGMTIFVSSVVGFIAIFWLSIRYGRASNRAKELEPIAAEYTPPKDMSILVSAQIGDGTRAVTTAQIIDLAVRHYITVTQTKEKSFWQQAEYELEIVKPVESLVDEEQAFIRTLFGDTAVGTKLATKSLKNNYLLSSNLYKNTQALTKTIKGDYGLRAGSEAASRPFKRAGLILLVVGLVTVSPLMLIAAIIAAICGWQLTPLTDKGLELRRYLAGLKRYIEAAEKDRLAMLQSPEGAEKTGVSIRGDEDKKLVRLYERVLPYAVLFGQEKEWNKQLAQRYENADASPDWYVGHSAFSAAVFTSAMNDFSGSMNSYGVSSSSSSGGSSGGGSSGGGGGGGGGGGW